MHDRHWQGHLQSQQRNALKLLNVALSKAIFMIENFSFRSGKSRHETALLFHSSAYCFYIHGSNGVYYNHITKDGNDCLHLKIFRTLAMFLLF
jgi:hypothetical protein